MEQSANIWKVAFATGSRADYGIMRRFLLLLNRDPEIELSIIATGALLDEAFGRQIELIYQDGLTVGGELKIPIDTTSNVGILRAMSAAQECFAEYFAEHPVDLLMILGDRYEMLSVATAAAVQRVPILHIHGGEATYGNYDEFIRHAITKMSLYHFTATETYRRRVIQLGEHPSHVYNLGALGAENCLFIERSKIPEAVLSLPKKNYFVVLFHPETLTDTDAATQMEEVIYALERYPEQCQVFLGSNADTQSERIRRKVSEYVNANANALYFENLPTSAYHFLLKNSICLIGNSSSGLIEAPSLGVYTINIGDRQNGRVRGGSVIDVNCQTVAIDNAIRKVLRLNGNAKLEDNPYYKENAASLYYETTKTFLRNIAEDTQRPKKFYDFPVPNVLS